MTEWTSAQSSDGGQRRTTHEGLWVWVGGECLTQVSQWDWAPLWLSLWGINNKTWFSHDSGVALVTYKKWTYMKCSETKSGSTSPLWSVCVCVWRMAGWSSLTWPESVWLEWGWVRLHTCCILSKPRLNRLNQPGREHMEHRAPCVVICKPDN